MSAVLTPPPTRPPLPIRWTVSEFHNMQEAGVFRGQRVMLIHGQVLEQHHGDPRHPGPRPLRWTREQYYRLGELGFFAGRRVQRIRGEIIDMSPIGWRHHIAKTVTADILREVFRTGHWVSEQGPTPLEESDPEPDVAVYPGKPRDYSDLPTGAVLLVEVADSSLAYDTTTKAELYATASIADYWVVDVDGRRLHVYRDPAPLAEGLAATAYRSHEEYGPDDTVAPLAAPDKPVKVADLLP